VNATCFGVIDRHQALNCII